MFVSLCKSYSQAINNGGIVIDSCWDNVVRTECELAFNEACKAYKNGMHKFINEKGIVDITQFDALHHEKEEHAINLFNDIAVGKDKQHFEQELKV